MALYKRTLGTFSLVMINIIAIDSIRNLPFAAALGPDMIGYYLIAALLFLFPCAWFTAQLTQQFHETGGVYIWVKHAIGQRSALIAVWLQWVYNLFWYPTIASFIASTLVYLASPAAATHSLPIFLIAVSLFSFATLLSLQGIHVAKWASTLCAIMGTIIPLSVIIALAFWWLLQGHFESMHGLAPLHFYQHWQHNPNLALLGTVVFSLMGLEMSSIHAAEVKSPERSFPRALLISSVLIVVTILLGSLSIYSIIPTVTHDTILLGISQALSHFLHTMHQDELHTLLLVLISVGSFGGMAAWVLGPSRALALATSECIRDDAGQGKIGQNPNKVLLAQWVLGIILLALSLFNHSVSRWYWLLSNLTAQTAILFYILFFVAATKLGLARAIQIKSRFKTSLTVFCGGLSVLFCIAVFVSCFIPPKVMQIGSVWLYESALLGTMTVFVLLPCLLSKRYLQG